MLQYHRGFGVELGEKAKNPCSFRPPWPQSGTGFEGKTPMLPNHRGFGVELGEKAKKPLLFLASLASEWNWVRKRHTHA